MDQAIQTTPNKEIKIVGHDGAIISNYTILNDLGNFVKVKNLTTGKILVIHRKRIIKDASQVCIKAQKHKKPKAQQNTIDVRTLASHGELWVKKKLEFDYDVEVNGYCLIFEQQNTYIFFNTYNGTFGRKNNAPPFDDIKHGIKKGYSLNNDVAGLRSKLTLKGYKLFTL
jgi:hypothetical protein